MWRIAFIVHWDGTSVVVTAFCSAHEAFGLVCFHGAFRVPGALGRGPLWRSQRLYCLGSVGVG